MIQVLAPEVVDRIAAGEVVERPASVVKELVENALDAEATEIVVDFSGGGVERIEVSDNGSGMSPEQAELAIQRHATSKIESDRDLTDVGSYGFRGEALPSIASVSHMSLMTRTDDTSAGHRIVIAGGEIIEKAPAGIPVGTRVRVEDLFFNTPARLKFLKTQRTETARVVEVVRHLALTHPHVAISLFRDGVEVFSTPAGQDEPARVKSILKRLKLLGFEHVAGPIHVRAHLTAPSDARVGASGLVLVVNGRIVVDRSLAGAIAAAHEGALPGGRYPQGVVYLELPRDVVDVNVHPQKREVRFSNPRAVTGALYRAVSRWAGSTPWKSGGSMQTQIEDAIGVAEPDRSSSMRSGGSFNSISIAGKVGAGEPLVPAIAPSRSGQIDAAAGRFASLRFIGQALGTFLVCESTEGLVLVDQHAAAERVTFERLRTQYRQGRVASQLLLAPARCDLDERQVDIVEQNEGLMKAFGLAADVTGPQSVTVREVPLLLSGSDPMHLIREVVGKLEDERGRIESIVEDVLATMACHGSVRGGDSLDEAGVRALLADLDTVDWGTHCPHGRPVSFEITLSELEKKLGRRG